MPALWRRFVTRTASGDVVRLAHPAGGVLELKVVWPLRNSPLQGFIGLECYTDFGEHSEVEDGAGVLILAPTGSCRRNEKGELICDAIAAAIPPGDFSDLRSGNFSMTSHPYVQS